MDSSLQSSDLNQEQNEVNQMKELIIKINQDKIMIEKKLQRRNNEITRLKSQISEKDEEINKKNKLLQSKAQQVNETQHDTITLIDGYSEVKQQLLQLQNLIFDQKEFFNEIVSEENKFQISVKVLEKIIQSQNDLKNDNVRLSKEYNQLRERLQKIQKDPESSSRIEKQNEDQLQNEIFKLQDQLRLDTNYYNKRINQLELMHSETQKELEQNIQSQYETQLILQAKITFLMAKIDLYEQAIEEISTKIVEDVQLKGQILNSYVSISKYLETMKNQKSNNSQNDNSKQEISKLESQKQFLMNQIINFEKNISQMEMIITNLEKKTTRK